MADQLQGRVYSTIKPGDNLSRPTFQKGKYGNPWDTWKAKYNGIARSNIVLQGRYNRTGQGVEMAIVWYQTEDAEAERASAGIYPSKIADYNVIQILPIVVPNMEAMEKPPADKIQITWIGHSTFLVQVDGLNFLTDPVSVRHPIQYNDIDQVWSNRCSPVSFAGPKRFRDVPFEIKDLPKIDFILISHNHYDHLDAPTVEKLHQSQPHAPVWIVPLGVASWFRKTLKGPLNVVELGWWDCIPLNEKVDVTGTPAQHWYAYTIYQDRELTGICRSKRSATDDFCSLWGGFVVNSKLSGKNIFFAGDTGYCSAFKEIGQKFGSFDLALIPIGAYLPRQDTC